MTPFPRQPGTAVLPMCSTTTRGSRCWMASIRSCATWGARGSYSAKAAGPCSYLPTSNIFVFRQQMLLDFSKSISGQLFDDDKRSWNLEGCELRAAAGFEIGGVHWPASDDVCYGHFPTDTIGRGGDGRFRHAVLLFQELFDLARIDV